MTDDSCGSGVEGIEEAVGEEVSTSNSESGSGAVWAVSPVDVGWGVAEGKWVWIVYGRPVEPVTCIGQPLSFSPRR